MKLTFLFFALILMSGCTRTVYVTKTEYVYPDRTWTIPVDYVQPPNRIDFEKAILEKRVQMLGEAYNGQTTRLGMCNGRLEAIRVWETDSRSKHQ